MSSLRKQQGSYPAMPQARDTTSPQRVRGHGAGHPSGPPHMLGPGGGPGGGSTLPAELGGSFPGLRSHSPTSKAGASRQPLDRGEAPTVPTTVRTGQNVPFTVVPVQQAPPQAPPAGAALRKTDPGSTIQGMRAWSTEGIARDPAAFLLQALEPLLPSSTDKTRQQIKNLVSKTIQVAESQARAVAESERAKAAELYHAAQHDLQATRLELHETERNRAELAALLEVTMASLQNATTSRGPGEPTHSAGPAYAPCAADPFSTDKDVDLPARRQRMALRIQKWWRTCRSRRECQLPRSGRAATGVGGPHDPYDAIVCFDSLNSTIDPENLRINILSWAQSAFNIAMPEASGLRIVAHMGLFDKGKTFLINKLYGKNLPSGKLHETTGLSMVYVPKKRFLVIDTKGLQAPVSYKTKGVKQLVDASQTETFLFELVSRIAHYIIFVVNDFTWPEQRHIVQLHQKYVQSKRENQLIVAHNLRTTGDIHEAEELFWKQVSSKYEGVDRTELGGLIFTVEEKPRIHHVGFAQSNSPAGYKFNQKNKQHLLQLLDQLEGIGERQRSMSQLLEEHFALLLPEFVYLESKEGLRRDGTDLKVVGEVHEHDDNTEMLEPDEELACGLYKSAGCLSLDVPAAHRVYMKTEGVFSEFCELVAQDVTFKPPPPNVYEQRLRDKVVRLVEFEIPGVLRKDIVFKRGNRGYTVNMARRKDEALGGYGIVPRMQAPRQPTGEFSFDLVFDDGMWELDGGRQAVTHDNGILQIRLKQDLHGETFSLEEDEREPPPPGSGIRMQGRHAE